jgi:precorrin-8X/cobalt-precorrin-8 methylmutase
MRNFTGDRLPDSYTICLLGHGSRDPEGIEEFLTLWNKLKERRFCKTIEYGFLGFAKPTVPEALSACLRDGIQNIIIVPGILLPGDHTKKDIPDAISKFFQGHPKANVHYAEPLGTQAEVMEVCRERIEEAEKYSPKSIDRTDTLLMTVAHGSHDTNINAQAEKNFLSFGEKLGFRKTAIHFAGTSQHSPETALEDILRSEFHRVIFLPYFLFSGVWVKRVNALADHIGKQYPNTEFLKTSCLKYHPLVIDTLIQRAQESIS